MRFAWASLALLATIGCGTTPSPAPTDGGSDGADTCTTDAVCDDGVFCNGAELCLPRSPSADARGCAVDSAPCAVGTICVEAEGRCAADCAVEADADGDGEPSTDCGGDDCDDADPERRPGLAEVCDADDVDEDCDPTTFGDRDSDSDSYVDARCCNGTTCGDDCDDAEPAVHPTEAETCNERDDDCDGATDETVTRRFVRDADRDGHGSAAPDAESIMACRPPSGFASADDDCDDAVGSTHPGALDRCDAAMVDDDCSGTPNDPAGGCACSGAETRPCPLPGACGAGTQTCVSGAWPTGCSITETPEVCGNGLDEDCDGSPDDGCVCDEEVRFCGSDVGTCMRGIQICTTDGEWTPCMDEVGPAPETCNMLDDDCDGLVDDGVFWRCYADTDMDGYSVPSAGTMELCAAGCPSGWTFRDPADPAMRDCDPAVASVHPGAGAHGTPRPGGGFDYDCDGLDEVVSAPVGRCSQRPDGSCTHGGGLVAIGGCGARAEYIVCITDSGGSSGPRCLEMTVCTVSDDCGDDNRTLCR